MDNERISDNRLMMYLEYGYTIDDIEDILSGGSVEEVREIETCCSNMKIYNYSGYSVCNTCGSVYGYDYAIDWIPEIWKYKKSIHSRKRWFYNKVKPLTHAADVDRLVDDFQKVARAMENNNWITGRKVSRYDFYVLRLASRRGIHLIKGVRDMKESKTRRLFEDRLFGQVYLLLGWDKDCQCKYYIQWVYETDLNA